MVDLRSDTLTIPTKEMRLAIAEAPVGDDVFGEDPTVIELQEYVAAILAMEAALFVPSGVMANQIALKINTNPGDEVIVESDSHIFFYETAAPSMISNIQLNCIQSEFGEIPIDEIENRIRPDIYYYPRTSLICLENTHNRHGGTVLSLSYLHTLKEFANSRKLRLHCDGARLWNASVAANLPPAKYSECFDTISVCLSKGLGAPIGSLICGTAEYIEKAKKIRKILGGGMRQVGILAAAGLYALKNNFPLLEYSHNLALIFANKLIEQGIEVDIKRVQTNIVMFRIPNHINVHGFEKKCQDAGVKIIPFGKYTIRAVFHFQINEQEALLASEIIADVIHSFN